jgi:hypothetical protein
MDIQEMTGELREERAFLDEARHTMARTAHGSGTAVDMLSQKCDALHGGRSASIFTACSVFCVAQCSGAETTWPHRSRMVGNLR